MIRFYYLDHPPTHLHAIYGPHEALIEIETGAIHQGHLPRTAHGLVNRWREVHLDELREAWSQERLQQPLFSIAPLE